MHPTKSLAIIALTLSSALTISALPLDTATTSKDIGIDIHAGENNNHDGVGPVSEAPVDDIDFDLEDDLELDFDTELEARDESDEFETEVETEVEIEAREPYWHPFRPCTKWWCRLF